MSKKWVYFHSYDEYYDFTKSVQNFEDFYDTSIEVRLTFNTDTRTAYYIISVETDHGCPDTWQQTHYIPWDDAINTIYRDGCDNFPNQLKEIADESNATRP